MKFLDCSSEDMSDFTKGLLKEGYVCVDVLKNEEFKDDMEEDYYAECV